MATILDIGLLEILVPVFVFILVFAISMAMLEKTKLMDNRALIVASALSIAILTTVATQLTTLIRYVTPWFLFLILVIFFMLGMFRFFGIADKEFWAIFGHVPVFIIALIIVLIGLTVVFEQVVSPYPVEEAPGGVVVTPDISTPSTGSEWSSEAMNPRAQALKTMTHPKILASLFMLIVAAISIKFLVDRYEEVA